MDYNTSLLSVNEIFRQVTDGWIEVSGLLRLLNAEYPLSSTNSPIRALVGKEELHSNAILHLDLPMKQPEIETDFPFYCLRLTKCAGIGLVPAVDSLDDAFRRTGLIKLMPSYYE